MYIGNGSSINHSCCTEQDNEIMIAQHWQQNTPTELGGLHTRYKQHCIQIPATHQLVCEHKRCLEAKCMTTALQKLLQVGPQHLHHKHVVPTNRAKPVPPTDAHCAVGACMTTLPDSGRKRQWQKTTTACTDYCCPYTWTPSAQQTKKLHTIRLRLKGK